MIYYDVFGTHYIALDEEKIVLYDSSVGDLDIRKYVNNTEFNQKEYEILSGYVKKRMIQPVDILEDELMFFLRTKFKV